MLKPVLALFALALATPAFAADPVKGEASFRKCKSCHSVIGPDGAEVQKGGKTGPNLWGLVGHPVASDPEFAYGDGLLTAKEKGVVWDEEQLATYLQDPASWVKAAAEDDSARSKMTFKLTNEVEAQDVAAYLATLGEPPAEGQDDSPDGEGDSPETGTE
jgi:cytochrome c